MRFSRFALLFLLGSFVFVSAAAAEDLTITYKVTGRGDATSTATQYYSASKIRMSDGQQDTILDLAAGKIINVDHKQKQYSEMTLAEIEAMLKDASAQMEQASAQMQEAMKNVPPAMRDKMKGMMGGGVMGGVVASMEVTKGGTRSVAGYSCQEYTITMGESVKTETCNTTALKPPFDPTQFQKMWSFSNPAFMKAAKDAAKMAEKFQQIQGLPLAEKSSVNVMGRSMTTIKEATEVKKGAIPASAFDPPAGYKKVDSPMKAAQQGMRPRK